MKKIKNLFICVLMVCALFGCSKSIPFEKKLAGKYSLPLNVDGSNSTVVQVEFIFNEDGSAEAITTVLEKSKTVTGTWEKVDDENIDFTSSGGTMTFPYTEEDDSITLYYGKITLIKE